MKPKLIVSGAAGRMGRRIISIGIDAGFFEIIAAVDRKDHPDMGRDAGILAGLAPINVKLSDIYPAAASVVIDFSSPAALDATLDYCLKNGVPLVLGTTGLGSEQMLKIEKACEKIAVIHATNMSMGMNLLFTLVGKVAAKLGEDYDIEIIEEHHRFKQDAPSGSALTLADNICVETGKNFPDALVYGRSGKTCPRQKGTIGMHSVRAGDIVGIHSIIFSTLGETVTLTHNAHSRDNFARGALRAAQWLLDKNAGLYSMADVLGLK